MFKFSSISLALVLIGSMPSSGKAATTLDNVGGYVYLSRVESRLGGGPAVKDLRQEYRARWHENLSEFLRVEAAYRYFNLDQTQPGQVGIWRKEKIPSVRINFNHPLFTITSYTQQRTSTAQTSLNDLTQKDFELGFRTRSLSIPLINANYVRVHNIGRPGEDGKNLLEKRLSFAVSEQFEHLELLYSFSRSNYENWVTQLQTISSTHQFRSSLINLKSANGRFTNSTSYQLDYSRRTDRLPNSQVLYHRIPVQSAIYLDQGDPLVAQLETVSTLTDGNKMQPTTPRIPIGAGQTGRQIGVDLGNMRSIGALYIYCDQISDPSLQWGVYVSNDNLNWELHELVPEVIFNTIDNRYEIEFDSVTTEYIKVVNRGFNQVDTVYVTEIEGYQGVAADEEIKQSYASHLVYSSSAYRLSDVATLYSDLNYQREPSVGLAGRQDNFYATTRLNYKLSEVTRNSLSFQQNYQMYSGLVADVIDYALQYTLWYNPLPTLGMTGSALGRISDFDHSRSSEDLSFSWRGTGSPITNLRILLGASYSQNRRVLLDQTSHTWTRQISLEGQLTESIKTGVSYDNLQTSISQTGYELVKDRYGATVTWRMSSKINIQGNWSWSTGGYVFESSEFMASWRLSDALNVSGMYTRSVNADKSTTDRKNFSSNWRISNRVSAQLSYIDNDFSQVGRDQSRSLQMGLRASF